MASAKCASGARSPDAPTLPCDGTRGRDPDVRELPEAGRHPVHRGAARDRPLHSAARRPHRVEGARGDGYGGAVPGDRDDVLDRERATVQSDGGWHSRGSYATGGNAQSHGCRHEEPSRRTVTKKRHGTTLFRDALPRRLLVTSHRDLQIYLLTINSGFPGSVCALQSKMTYRRPTAVTRSAA